MLCWRMADHLFGMTRLLARHPGFELTQPGLAVSAFIPPTNLAEITKW